MSFQNINDVLNSNDTIALIEHCKEGVIENNQINGGSFSDWDNGKDIADCYLDFGGESPDFLSDNPDEKDLLIKSLDEWLSKQV